VILFETFELVSLSRLTYTFMRVLATFTFAICRRPSVCLLYVTFVIPTQSIEIFGNVSMPFDA